MIDIKKKIIAVTLVCAMSVSMAACSDKNTKNGIRTETLSSEEAEQLKRVAFSIEEFTEAADNAQDPVEGVELKEDLSGNDNGSAGGDSGNNDAQDGNGNNGGGNGGNNDGQSGGADNQDGNNAGGNSGGNNNSNQGGSGSNGGNNDNQSGGSDNNTTSSSGSSVITGTEKKQQAFWMDLSGDFVFDGEFITATFKIKDTTANGTYPILIKWLDFSNIKAVSLDATGIDGSVVVGGTAEETKFKNDGSFEVKADSVSGNPGDTVTVSFRFNNNPGICASVFRFSYDSDALEYVSGVQGADFVNALETQNQ